ncbi:MULTISPECIES: ATP-binding cassette domain-containing protein [Corynebacterium]|uniref:ATP-binding cassette domain-containing protein n=1 Tax=Corynebacterium TaxID=1716 RepID=UPI0003B7F51C|nr:MULTISPECIES: ATP-binding cassette domain-containing protein [Corynebacterium]ERS58034.1 hypothetical protein HMPREF1261_02090 [Corynebacterium sp. KPL1818]MDK4208962.1 ATP-binding cassette domain-containing protein [Corynebacterium accolens]
MSFEVSLEHITKSFGSQAVLRDISFHISPGRVHAVLGRNGAGKSTLFSIFLGLLPADSGTVRVAGEPWSREVLDYVGASVNGPAFYGHLSATDNLRVHTRLLGLPDTEIDRVLHIAGLAGAGSKKAKSFSTGMKARLALAQALLGDPEILLLDEPQNGLDPQGIAELRKLLQQLAAAGHTVVVSSHQLGEVLHLAPDITILSQGTIRYSGSLQELAPSGELEAEFFRLTSADGETDE